MADVIEIPGVVKEGVSISVNEVLATLGYVPAALIGALSFRNFDLTSHHRKSVLKYQKFPAGRRAQRMIAAGLHRYGRKRTAPEAISDVVGETFAAANSGVLAEDYFKHVEFGGVVRSKEYMAIPLAGGRRGSGPGDKATSLFRKLVAEKGFDIRPGGWLTYTTKDGKKSILMGVLRRQRHQPAVLGFYDQFDKIMPKHLARYERDIGMALTEAGRASLGRRTTAASAAHLAWRSAYREAVAGNGGDRRGAKKVADAAYREAKKDALGQT